MEKKSQKKKVVNPPQKQQEYQGFLQKIFKILETDEYKDMITWTEDGTSFKVLKPTEFSEIVLPKFFKTNKFTSFVRQLNMYDFHKVSKIQDTDENEWKHPNFLKDKPELLTEIKRKITEKNPKIDDQTGMQILQHDQREVLDTKIIFKEIDRLSAKQDVLEKACQILITQNNQILSENKILWQEMTKNRDRQDRKLEKLLQLIFMFFQNGGTNKLNMNQRNSYTNAVKLDDDEIDDMESYDKPLTNKQKQALIKQNSNQEQKEAEKMLKKLVKNMHSSIKQPKNQFETFVDSYHQNNTDLLKNMQMCLEDNNSGMKPKRRRESIDYQFDTDSLQNGQKKICNKQVPQKYIQRLEEQDKLTEQNAELLLKSLENRIDSSQIFKKSKKREPLMITEKSNTQMMEAQNNNINNNEFLNDNDIILNSYEEDLPQLQIINSLQQLQKPLKKNSNVVQIQEETSPFSQMNSNYEMSPLLKQNSEQNNFELKPYHSPNNNNNSKNIQLQKPPKNNSSKTDFGNLQNNNNIQINNNNNSHLQDNNQFNLSNVSSSNKNQTDFVKDFFINNTNNNENNNIMNIPQSPILFDHNNDDFDNNMLFLSRQPSLQKNLSQIDLQNDDEQQQNQQQNNNEKNIKNNNQNQNQNGNNNNNNLHLNHQNQNNNNQFQKKIFTPQNCRNQNFLNSEQDGVDKYINNSNLDHNGQMVSHENSFFE